MINKKKRYAIALLESPLTIIAFVIKLAVAFLDFTYIRLIKKGILMGSQFEKNLEFHEQGRSRNK